MRQALATLVGLEAAPAARGGFTYTHRPTGFVFELGPYAPSAEEAADMEDDGAAPMDVDGGWVAYNPVHFGQAYEVRLLQRKAEGSSGMYLKTRGQMNTGPLAAGCSMRSGSDRF